jgi:membrane-bound hydrogenase subunit beta
MSLEQENEKIIEDLVEYLGEEAVLDYKIPRAQRAFVSIKRDKLREAANHLKEEGFTHITTISGVDTSEEFEVVYHITSKQISIALKIKVPKDDPKVPSITDIFPGAVLYEREVNDLFGIFPEGHPDPKRLILPYDWPNDVYPLRKEWDIDTLRERVDGKEEKNE